jgi:hypothetical protein
VKLHPYTLYTRLWGAHGQIHPTIELLVWSMTPYLLTYLLTPWSPVLPEKLTGLQLVKKFPAFYGTRTLIAAGGNWVSVTKTWRVLRLLMKERLPLWRVATNILNKQSRTAD